MTVRAHATTGLALLLALAGAADAQTAPSAPAVEAAPRLADVDAALQPLVKSGQLSGAVMVIYRGGRLIHASALGQRDLASATPMTIDTIFRAYSMTKPVTAVAMMILYDEGKWRLEDPVAKFLPEFADIKVFKGMGSDGKPILEAPASPPTMGQLMTQTAGFSYGFAQGYVDDRYRAADIWSAANMDDFVRRIAAIPLAYQPGTQWRYSVSVDLQGAIVERLSGKKLGDFMRERIFEPLGMDDTGFFVPPAKWSRLASLYGWADDRLQQIPSPFAMTFAAEPAFASGGGGLVTTAGDYARFGRMLLGKGALDGARVLSAASAEAIMTSHLPPALIPRGFGIGFQGLRPGYEYGFDGVVVTDPAAAHVAVGRGTYLWDGAAGTWFWVDPENQLVFVGMVQRLMGPGFPSLQPLAQGAVRTALTRRR